MGRGDEGKGGEEQAQERVKAAIKLDGDYRKLAIEDEDLEALWGGNF